MHSEEQNVHGELSGLESRSTEVKVKASRRQFTDAYIDAVLKELDEAPHGEVGKILRREGLYTKQISRWRKQRATGTKAKRGPKSSGNSEVHKELARKEREIARLKRKLEQAELIIDVQKKVSALLSSTDTTEEQP